MIFRTKNFGSRFLNRIYTFWFTKLKERTYGNDKNRVKYLFFERGKTCIGADVLAVCFPAFAGKGAKYNYVRTLKDFNINKLYLLDDIGGVDKGNYFLKKGVEENVRELIMFIIDRYKPSKLIFFGSSKGGYASLNFSLYFSNVFVCIAAPQYYLFDYLTKEKKFSNIEAILGTMPTEEDKKNLNNTLCDKIANAQRLPQRVYIHYSTEEHTYKEHIVDLLEDLKTRGIPIVEDVRNYTNHMDLVYYFPDFLKKSVTTIIESKE